MSENAAQPYLSVDLGEHGGQMEWMSHEELAQWLTKLQNDWNWVSHQRISPAQNAWKKIGPPLHNANQAVIHAQNHLAQGQEQQAASQLSSAKSWLENLIRTYPWLLPNQARRLFLEGHRDAGNPMEAALIVAHWTEEDFNNAPIRQSINAVLTWELYERGIKERMKTESAALKRLLGEMQTKLTEFQGSERDQVERFEELYGSLADQKSAQQSTFESTQNDRDQEWLGKLATVQQELDLLKKTYDEHMALAAPVEYWEKKRRGHRTLAVTSFVAMLICMLAVGWFLHVELSALSSNALVAGMAESNEATTVTTSGTLSTTLQSANAWKFGALLMMATLGFWLIRLIVRIFLSSLHLENDAAERVTMAKTYLALLRDDSLPKDGSIGAVLAALFRPTGDGIVKDEGLPPTAMEWMTRLGGK
ncbi:hypothetical protein GO613_08495 [Azoarcus communis]|uniref:DUF6161 domain-containing protein n=1 Tax=Parazoarcus communis TaxID=41977 RepID=UPI001459E5EA|nr:DUF6161 domain-containing protein [Parazoarcus communis]NMG48137.1 hypothetical protein [Parazoarcus communis]